MGLQRPLHATLHFGNEFSSRNDALALDEGYHRSWRSKASPPSLENICEALILSQPITSRDGFLIPMIYCCVRLTSCIVSFLELRPRSPFSVPHSGRLASFTSTRTVRGPRTRENEMVGDGKSS